MQKYLVLLIISLFAGAFSYAQQKTSVYNPAADAQKEIDSCVALAKKEKKFVLMMGGGDWCIWCHRFDEFVKSDRQLDSLVNANFIWYHLNYSKENENVAVFRKYGYPQRFGFPVLLVLDTAGNRLHTQSSWYLEKDKSYDRPKVMEFFEMWSPAALNPKLYGD